MSYPHYRDVLDLHRGRATSDGDGVRLTRIIGGPDLEPATTSAASRRTRTAVSRRSPSCSKGACATRTTSATAACSSPAACSG